MQNLKRCQKSVTKINNVLIQYLKNSKLNPSICGEQNVNILNKDKIGIIDFFLLLRSTLCLSISSLCLNFWYFALGGLLHYFLLFKNILYNIIYLDYELFWCSLKFCAWDEYLISLIPGYSWLCLVGKEFRRQKWSQVHLMQAGDLRNIVKSLSYLNFPLSSIHRGLSPTDAASAPVWANTYIPWGPSDWFTSRWDLK